MSDDNHESVDKPETEEFSLEAKQANRHNLKAQKFFEAGQYAEAEAEIREAIKLVPNCASFHDNLGTICAEQNKFQEALIHYIDALRIDPDSPTISYNLGYFLLQAGLDTSQFFLEKTLEREPLYPDARRTLGDLFVERGENRKAIAAFARAIEQNPADKHARFHLSNIFWDQGDYHEAAQQIQAILQANPADPVAWHKLGMTAIMLQDFNRAEQALCKAIELDPAYLMAHYHLACVYTANFQLEQALYHLNAAAAIDLEQVRELAQEDEQLDRLRTRPLFDQILSGEMMK
jgi:Flp pilus assembly protein TadD